LFVLLKAVGAVGGTVLLICTLAACFKCFQSEHPRTPDFEIAVVVDVGFITDYSRIAQAFVRIAQKQTAVKILKHWYFHYKLHKQAAVRIKSLARGRRDRCQFLQDRTASLELQKIIRRKQHRWCYLQALPKALVQLATKGIVVLKRFGQGRRVALCIGIDYIGDQTLDSLPNCVADAEDMRKCCLEQLGFDEAKFIKNANKEDMLKALEEFVKLIEDGSLVFFLFSGHGAEHENVNYLLPLGMTSTRAEDYTDQAVSLNSFIMQLRQSRRNIVNVILLDCCRANERTQIFESVKSRTKFLLNLLENRSQSHQATERNAEFLFGFACDPGEVAFANVEDNNSNYTEALLKHLPVSGRTLEDSMKEVSKYVSDKTSSHQRPWYSSCLHQTVVLVPSVQNSLECYKCPHAAGGRMCYLSLMQVCIYVCMYVCIYVYMCVCMYVYMYIHIYKNIFIYIYISISLSIYLSIYLSISLSIYLSIFMCMYMHIYVDIPNSKSVRKSSSSGTCVVSYYICVVSYYMYVCMYVCIYVYI
jgi:hypothetical protein